MLSHKPQHTSLDIEWLSTDRLVDYPLALDHMEQRVNSIIEGHAKELIWLLQHPPLYTGGTSADIAELKDTSRFPIYDTGRGGRYTYHGPGQRVIYAMIDLRKRDKDLRTHVWRLEEWVIRVLADFGIKGERREGRIGIWVNHHNTEQKIAAIGVRVRKWVAYHGLALNVDPNLNHFDGIVPCGIAEFGVTSMRKVGVDATMEEIDDVFKKYLDVLVSGF